MIEHKQLVVDLYKLLPHLQDVAYLESHPLAECVPSSARSPAMSRGQALRRTLRLAIAALDPGTEGDSGALEARPYRVLFRHAISRHSMLTIADQLSISRRQAYRELRLAIEALAHVLADVLAEPPANSTQSAGAETSDAARVRSEVERLAGDNEDVDVGGVVEDALKRVERLAHERGVVLRMEAAQTLLHVETNRVLLRQAILNLFSHVVETVATGPVDVRLHAEAQRAVLEVVYSGHALPDRGQLQSPYGIAAQILESLGIALAETHEEQGRVRLTLSIPLVRQHAVLIIDDNEGLIHLFKSFLRDQPYQVYGTTSATQALDLLARVQPDVVVLDIMMPGHDGWEVLEALRATEAGRRAAVIICSVINDPQLSAALGADGFLLKPVERTVLLQTLGRALSLPK